MKVKMESNDDVWNLYEQFADCSDGKQHLQVMMAVGILLASFLDGNPDLKKKAFSILDDVIAQIDAERIKGAIYERDHLATTH